MSNSNVMAIEDYGYQTDQYENYANDMANDNYHKSQGSEYIKIKCNNINSNFNGVEANIGNDDSLGELGASSLQGDDASAIWFGNGQANNENFDFDCINNNDNVGGGQGGGTGPQGPPGPIGQRSPAGPNQISTTISINNLDQT